MENGTVATMQKSIDTEMQRCLVDCYQSPYPLARLELFLGSLRSRGVSPQEVHQIERAILRMLATLRSSGHPTTNPEPRVVKPRPK
jgi:hypothetical protein